MTLRAITLAAHSKINLFLRVEGREPSGYHQIETLFQRLALADGVQLAITDGPRALNVEWDGLAPVDLGPMEQNLAWRAALSYRTATGWPKGWTIDLTKRIPAGAGLGGGSSDAAAVLRGLDTLAPVPLGDAKLAELGATLGADVAFFVRDRSLSLGRGRGDQLEPVRALDTAAVLLAIPPFGVATGEAYAALAAARAATTVKAAPPPKASDGYATWGAVAKHQLNDFEPTVFARHPELQAARRWLEKHGALIARLSGTGSVVFGLWPGTQAPTLDPPEGFRLLLTKTA